MTPAGRRDYLAGLGLVDWQLRVASAGGADISVVIEETGEEPVVDPVPAMPEPAEVVVKAESEVVDLKPDSSTTDLSSLNWEELEAWLDSRDRRGAQRAVFGAGARDADVLVIGEAPGEQEDKQGLPFVGPAGQLLDRMLAAIGRSRQRDVYITNICKFRPPGNREPHTDELAADWPVLERQIDLMDPKLVIAVGRVAAQNLLGCSEPLGKLRGQVHDYPRRTLPVIVTYHPAYLLRYPGEKVKSWADLKRIAALLNGINN